ncbi:MAG: O-antigen ligase family protein [Myxococcales bacterium]|nr:O-antigen ligase family protein [Myxococcales bacterium]
MAATRPRRLTDVSGSRTHKWALAGLALAMVVLIGGAGGVLRWSVAIAMAATAGTFALVAGIRAEQGAELGGVLPRYSWPLVVGLAFALLQVLPLPHALVSWLSPGKAALVVANASALRVAPPEWYALSYDVPLTLLAIGKLLLAISIAQLSMRLAMSSHGRRNLAALVVGTASLVALVTWANTLLAPGFLWGVLRSPVVDGLTSPLLNLNHLAGFLSLACPLAVAQALRSEGAQRAVYAGALTLLVATVLATGSRGGLLGLCVALIIAVPMIVQSERLAMRHVRRAQWMAIALAAVAALAIYGISSQTLGRELAKTEVAELSQRGSKFWVWRQSVDLLGEAPLVGVGTGAFEPAFAKYAQVAGVRYSHPENAVVQRALDVGFLGALAILGLWLWLMAAAWRHAQESSLRAAAWAGLLGLLVHDLFDFSLEMPLVLGAALVCAAIAVPVRAVRVASPRAGLWTKGGVALAAVATLAITAMARPTSAELAPHSLVDAQAVAELERIATRHPADDQAWARLGEAMMRRHDPRTFAVLARAVTLNPSNVAAHMVLGTAMSRASARPQAPAAFATALALSRNVSLVRDISAALPSAQEAALAIPINREDGAFWLHELARAGHKEIAQAYARRVGQLFIGDGAVQLAAAQTLMTAEPHAALRHARAAEALAPSVDTAVALAYAHMQTQAPEQALAIIVDPRLDARAATPRGAYPLHVARVEIGLVVIATRADPAIGDMIERSLAAREPLLQSTAERNYWYEQGARWHDHNGHTEQAAALRRQIVTSPPSPSP